MAITFTWLRTSRTVRGGSAFDALPASAHRMLSALTTSGDLHTVKMYSQVQIVCVRSFRVLGGLKVGKKKLYVYHGAQLHELTSDCV